MKSNGVNQPKTKQQNISAFYKKADSTIQNMCTEFKLGDALLPDNTFFSCFCYFTSRPCWMDGERRLLVIKVYFPSVNNKNLLITGVKRVSLCKLN